MIWHPLFKPGVRRVRKNRDENSCRSAEEKWLAYEAHHSIMPNRPKKKSARREMSSRDEEPAQFRELMMKSRWIAAF